MSLADTYKTSARPFLAGDDGTGTSAIVTFTKGAQELVLSHDGASGTIYGTVTYQDGTTQALPPLFSGDVFDETMPKSVVSIAITNASGSQWRVYGRAD